MAATKAPTGITITRSGNVMTVKWKIADKDYGDGQQIQWRVSGKKWASVAIGTGTTAKSFTLPAAQFYPNAGKPTCPSFFVRIRGNRKSYKSGKSTINPGWSAWATKRYDFLVPLNPSISAALNDSLSNVTTFTWSVTNAGTDRRHFTNIEWQTVLVKNCNYADGAKAPWKTTTLGWGTGTTGVSGSLTRTEDSTLLAQASYTRWVRVRARGIRGASAWRYAKHVYARPYQAVINSTSANVNTAGGFQCSVKWTAGQPYSNPIDSTHVQYAITTPAAGLACPSGASWTDADTSRDTSGTDAATFSIDDVLDVDQCLFVRVNTIHDRNTTYGIGTLASVGFLADPTGLSVTTNDNTHKATVTATNNSTVPGAFLAIYYKTASAPDEELIVGIIPNGQTSATVQCPNWAGESGVAFGVRAIVGTYTGKTRADGVESYQVIEKMTSENTKWDGGAVPSAPTNVTASRTDQSGVVNVAWDWSWEDADSAELSWADNSLAWQSTSEPTTYEVSNLYASNWNIAGLETGITWYIRVRLIYHGTDTTTYGPYSDPVTIDLSSAPSIPVLSLSAGVITEDGSVTASWAYSSTDGTGQGYAEICEYSEEYVKTTDASVVAGKTYYTYNADTSAFAEVETPVTSQIANYYEKKVTYGDIIAHTETAQHVTITAQDVGWTAGNQYGLCVRVVSRSGRESDSWSTPVFVSVAEPLVATILETSLKTVTVVDDDEEETTSQVTALTEMPLTLTVTGAGVGGTTSVIIERAASYYLDRPDESKFNGHEGETIAIVTQTGEGQITISRDILMGDIDDGAPYRIVATVQDGLGQSAQATQDFTVVWDHQAVVPDAAVVMDQTYNVAKITPIAPTGTAEGDTCDIYRLSADRPEIIVEGGEWGTTYVDPYPTIGEFGGHRVVFKTVNGDYITADNHEAWVDLGEEDGDRLNLINAVIDFDGRQMPITLNATASHSWEKDFKETRYLGGAVQGDWNAGTSRTGSMSAELVEAIDTDTIAALRRLATWTGICHVRTLDGSSFAADVQFSEDISWEQGAKIRGVSLSITRVDPEGMDGLTLEQWEQGQEGA